MFFMKQALRIAEEGRMTCMPNPMVGCIIVKDSTVVGMGAHLKAGGPHAEINALAQAGDKAKGADVYLTLEPCSHFGKTPPCVNAIIAASVKSVHIALEDPNPLVSGNGITRLRQAGIDVHVGECQEEAYLLNKSFFYFITHKKPFVLAKWAMSLDGKIAGGSFNQWGPNRWITSEDARAHAHMIRAEVGGIMVGENTVRVDNPVLTIRHSMTESLCLSPRPIVLTTRGDIPFTSKIFECGKNTLVMTSKNASPSFLSMLDKNKIEYHFVSAEDNFLLLPEIMDKIGALGISRLLVEGGSQLLTQCFKHDVVNKIYAYVAPKIIGGDNALSPIMGNVLCDSNNENIMQSQEMIRLGPDVCFVAETGLTPRTYDDFIKRRKQCLQG